MAMEYGTQVSVKVISGGRVEKVTFASDEELTVAEALSRANVVLNPSQAVAVNGQPAELTDELEDGDRIVAAGNKQAGRR